jgi:ribosomal protein L37AE/L43A
VPPWAWRKSIRWGNRYNHWWDSTIDGWHFSNHEGTLVNSENEKTTQRGAEENMTETPLVEQSSHCLICGQRGPTLSYGHWICDHCKNVVTAEAVSKKRKIEKEGGGSVLT